MFNRGVQKTEGDILSKLRVTSKLAVKLSCISIYPDDIIKAEQLYEFIVKDMPDLPDTDPIPPTGFEKVKTGVGDVVGFIRNNKDDIMQVVQIVQGLISRRGGVPIPQAPVEVPPLPKM